MQPIRIPGGQPVPSYMYGGNVTGYNNQGPMMMPVAGGAGGGGVPPGVPVILGSAAPGYPGGNNCPVHPQGPVMANHASVPHHHVPQQPYGQLYGQPYAHPIGHAAHPQIGRPDAGGDDDCLQPVDFKPVCEDPSKMFMVRQTDKEWCKMPFATIESFGNSVRWYIRPDGAMYAEKFED